MSAVPMEVLEAGQRGRVDHSALVSAPSYAVISAEIDQQVSTAKKYPRAVDKFQKSLRSQATLSQPIAAQCTYKKPRGGKIIEGPSVRFMELVIANWGNCRAGAQLVAEGETTVTAQGVFHDLESNMAITLTATRSILDSKGKRYDADMIATTTQAAISIAFRNVVQKGVPKALWIDIHEETKRVALGDLSTLAQRRQNALEWFKAVGVTEKQIIETLGITGIADIDLHHLATLGGYKVSIEEDGTDPEEIFVAVDSKTPSARSGKKATTAPKPPQNPGDANAGAPSAAQTSSPGVSASPGTAETKSDEAAVSQNGAAGSSLANSSGSVSEASSEPPAPVTDAKTAIVYAAHLEAAVRAAKTSADIDELHAEAMKSGQWRALQKHDQKRHADISSLMATRQADIDSDDGQRPPD